MTDLRKIEKIARVGNQFSSLINHQELGSGEAELIHYVRHHPMCCVKDISNGLGIDKAAVSRRVNSMIAKGLLSKSENKEDNRSFKICATIEAEEKKQHQVRTQEIYYDFLFDGIELNKKDVFLEVLDQIYKKSKDERKNEFRNLKERMKRNEES